MAVPTSSLYGLGYLGGNALGGSQQAANSHYNDYLDAFRYQMQAASQAQYIKRYYDVVSDRMVTKVVEPAGVFSDVDKYGKTGIDLMEEGARPIVALRREIEGWLPKL